MKPRIMPVSPERTEKGTSEAFSRHEREHKARITNMKRTLGHSQTAFEAYMVWYPLYDEVKKILGERLACLYAWSISEASECLLCSTYFRKSLIDSGESPESLAVSDDEQRILDFGAAISRNRGFVDDAVFSPIRKRFNDSEIVLLTAFAGIMVATNIFNNVIGTEIDEYLHAYKKPGHGGH